MKAEIQVVKGAARATLSFQTGRPVTIGRSQAADMQVLSGVVSRLHCQVQGDGQSWTLKDLDSRNGTWMSGERVKIRDLEDGSIFTLGKRVAIRFRTVAEAAPVSSKPAAAPAVPASGPAPDPEDDAAIAKLIGIEVGGVRIIEKLDGEAPVYRLRAHQPSLNRHVLLYAFDEKTVSEEGFQNRLLDEIRGVSRLLHPKILQIHDLIEHDGSFLVVTEYFPGTTLADVLEKKRFVKVPAALSISSQVADALAYAEAQEQFIDRIGTRDIYVNDENAAKLDFFRPPVTRKIDPICLSYTAPEVISGGGLRSTGRPAASERDTASRGAVYSLGAILYHMLAGIPPYEGQTEEEMLPKILKTTPPSLRRVNLKVSPALARVVERAMDKDAKARPANFREFQLDLKKIIAPAL